jgi:hypothetical protein
MYFWRSGLLAPRTNTHANIKPRLCGESWIQLPVAFSRVDWRYKIQPGPSPFYTLKRAGSQTNPTFRESHKFPNLNRRPRNTMKTREVSIPIVLLPPLTTFEWVPGFPNKINCQYWFGFPSGCPKGDSKSRNSIESRKEADTEIFKKKVHCQRQILRKHWSGRVSVGI